MNDLEMVMFIFDQKYLFRKILKKLELSISAEFWYLDQFEYAELNRDVRFFCFQTKMSFLRKCGPKVQNSLFKVKFST